MRRVRFACLGLLALLAAGWLAPAAPAQVLPKLKQTVRLPDLGAGVPLKDALDYLTERYKLKITVDQAAFKNQGLDDIRGKEVRVGALPPLRLSTVLEVLLDQADATFVVRGNAVVIIPGATALRDESRTSPLAARLRQTMKSTAVFKGGQVTVREALDYLSGKYGLPILVNGRAFRGEAVDPRESLAANVKLKERTNVPLATVLQEILGPAGARFVIRADHIMVVPRSWRGQHRQAPDPGA